MAGVQVWQRLFASACLLGTISGCGGDDAAEDGGGGDIGFAEPGYDELEYARIAARAFGLHGHEARVDEDAAVDAIGEVVRAFDEPFGNASAIPTLHCARNFCHARRASTRPSWSCWPTGTRGKRAIRSSTSGRCWKA